VRSQYPEVDPGVELAVTDDTVAHIAAAFGEEHGAGDALRRVQVPPLVDEDYRDAASGSGGRFFAAFAPIGATGYVVVVISTRSLNNLRRGSRRVRHPRSDLLISLVNPAASAIATSRTMLDGSPLRFADVVHLIALKLYAGGPREKNDVIELLERHPELEREPLLALCARFDLDGELRALLAELDGLA
jgi:hypothetical protein